MFCFLNLGEEAAKKLFDEAMEKGYVESRAIVLLLIGAAGAGKSHFKHLILRLLQSTSCDISWEHCCGCWYYYDTYLCGLQ